MAFHELIAKLASSTALSADEADRAAEAMLSGNWTLAQTGGWLTALHIKGTTANVLTGTAHAMQRMSRIFAPARRPLADIAHVQSSGAEPAWITVTSAIVAASTGSAPVALAGSRARTGIGISEVIEALGFGLHVPRPQVKASLDRQGFGFLYEPDFLPPLAALAPLRRDLGFSSLFEEAIALVNPASPEARVICVSSGAQLDTFAQAAAKLGAQRGYIVCGASGLGVATGTGETHTAIFESRGHQRFAFRPADYGFGAASLADFAPMQDAAAAQKAVRAVLSGKSPRAHADAVVMNAGFVLHVAGAARTLEECFELARKAMASGDAAKTLDSAIAIFKSTGSNPALKPYM